MRYAGRLWVDLTLTQCSGQKTSGVSKNSAAMVCERCSTGMTRASVNMTRGCQTPDVRLSFIWQLLAARGARIKIAAEKVS